MQFDFWGHSAGGGARYRAGPAGGRAGKAACSGVYPESTAGKQDPAHRRPDASNLCPGHSTRQYCINYIYPPVPEKIEVQEFLQ